MTIRTIRDPHDQTEELRSFQGEYDEPSQYTESTSVNLNLDLLAVKKVGIGIKV